MAAGASPLKTFQKDPSATLDYTLNWKEWLGDDRISSVVWTVPAGIANAGVANSPTTTTIFLSGGTSGTSYSVYVTVTTTQGRIEKRTIKINVLER